MARRSDGGRFQRQTVRREGRTSLVSGSGTGRIPRTLRQEFELSDENDWDSDAARLIEHYGLDPEKVWFFWRQSYRRNSVRFRAR